MFKAQFFLCEKILQFGYATTNIRQKIMTLRIISLVMIHRKKYMAGLADRDIFGINM